MKTIGLASDHAGYELKEYIKTWLEAKGYTFKDFGTYSADSCDYADFAHPLANAVEAEHGLEKAEAKIGQYLDKAADLLDQPHLPRNGYYAFVCEKCASVFGYFGYFLYEKELSRRASEIYERA